jgi:protein-S-isoprenylcysteine O-methyltransferase Ste14
MPVHSYFVLTAFTFLFFMFALQFMRLRNSGSELLGTPTIEKLYFYSGKIAIFSTWALFIVKAISPRLGYIYLPASLSWIAVGLLYFGILILSISSINLGKSLKIGLPGEATTLQTKGLYRLSRNPIYTGVHMIAIASCIYFPDLINISFTIYGIYIHHKIIKQEESFLEERFGNSWLLYSARVSRYI